MTSNAPVPSATTTATRPTWIFQANPKRYDIERSLRAEREELWNLRQHAKAVKAGDRALIWLSGPKAGIYAIGTVLADPIIQADTPTGIGYWVSKREGQRAIARVPVRYERILLDRPLQKVFLDADLALQGLRILHFPRGTVFAVTEAEWQAIALWLASP
jgi:predicted RNA-binding protein with PUA-like domain